ncbi:hypothetical protein OGAPHI_006532 [Ogataea philodendri]|uniref:Inositol polyphosphate-related phosphatase domain-containing protein n=1 Tax=Ogataea philodendri TaxID=1378263 RepID=A0A9P8NY30_9ASCO|nr:uncharacterized protein OGAPHI_006532 [Ogataea philodendri]KAH3661682.1 hypothetical protein OGAPHI_006532 [Ogataea philodendri]
MEECTQVKLFRALNPSSKFAYQSILQSDYVSDRIGDVSCPKKLKLKLLTWNLAAMDTCPKEHIKRLLQFQEKHFADIYIIGFQETVPLTSFGASDKQIDQWCDAILAVLPENFQVVQKTGMLGLTSILVVSGEYAAQVSDVRVRKVGLGYLNWYNKGCIEMQFSLGAIDEKLGGVRVQALNMHLTHGEDEAAVDMRNQCLKKVQDSFGCVGRASFAAESDCSAQDAFFKYELSNDETDKIAQTDLDRVFAKRRRNVVLVSGDLNYRVDSESSAELVSSEQYNKLLESDQLSVQKSKGAIFFGFTEGPVKFRPTYKVNDALAYEGNRSPSYTDRVLYSTDDGLEQLSYTSYELNGSDHLPVVSEFVLDVDVVDYEAVRKLRSEIGLQFDKIINQTPTIDVEPSLIDLDLVLGFKETVEVTVTNLTAEQLRYRLDVGKKFLRKNVIKLLNDDGQLPPKQAKILRFEIDTPSVGRIEKTFTMTFDNFEFVKFLAFTINTKSIMFQLISRLDETQYRNIVQSMQFIMSGSSENLVAGIQKLVDVTSLNEFEVSLLKEMTLKRVDFGLLTKLNSIGMVENEGSVGLMNVVYLFLKSVPEFEADKRSRVVFRKMIELIKFLQLDETSGFKYFGFFFADEHDLAKFLE